MEFLKIFISMPMRGRAEDEIENFFIDTQSKAIEDIKADEYASKNI